MIVQVWEPCFNPRKVITKAKASILWTFLTSMSNIRLRPMRKQWYVPYLHGHLLPLFPWFKSLTHLPLVSHIFVSELGQHCLRRWTAACSAPSHCLNRYWLIVNWTQVHFTMSPANMVANLPKCWWVKVAAPWHNNNMHTMVIRRRHW